jgi:hypothetical protein
VAAVQTDVPEETMELPLERVLAWRLRRQLLDRPLGIAARDVVVRLCGVQAQVASSAEQAIAQRRPEPVTGGAASALRDRSVVKTWAMRGTLHLLSAEHFADYLSLIAAARTWEKGTWQRTFATAKQIALLADAAPEALHGRELTREQLCAEIVRLTGDESIAEALRSSWGAVLKPLAWQGLLVYGTSDGNRVTFTSPQTWLNGWTGLPDPDEAASRVIPAYLGAFGPASAETFDQWLLRGMSKKSMLRGWFSALVSSGAIVQVDVDGVPAYARAADVEEIAACRPSSEVRLLPAFDQYVLGPGTKNAQIIPAGRRDRISKAAGWISPVVVCGGRVAGTWEANGSALDVVLFPESGPVPRSGLDAEAERLGAILGAPLQVSVTTA